MISFEAYIYHLSLYFIVKCQLLDHFLQKMYNGKLGSHFMLNKSSCLLILIAYFSLLTFTYWILLLHKNIIKYFHILKGSQKHYSLINSEKSRQVFIKGKIHLKCSYTVGHKFGVYIVGCHISDKTILLGR